MSEAVLIVDDEPHILQSLKRLLRRDGYSVLLADNGPTALDILAETDVAVLICDQRMPDMTGAEVLAKAYALRPDTVRITLTGHTDLAAAQASINEGHVSHFLLKPWDDEMLRAIVRDAVQAHGLVNENRRLDALTRQQKDELEAWNQRLEEQVRERTEALRAQNETLVQLQHRAEQSLRDTVGVLAGTLEAHNPNLGIHCKRVAQLARELASRLHLGDRDLRDVEFAAHLHDLGKISRAGGEDTTPSPQPARHTEAGYAILSKVSGFHRIALAIRHQHERFDGRGYPDGLTRDAIPLASRIIAVVDAYDRAVFLTSNPTDVSHEAGCKLLRERRGKRLDPHLVDALLQYFEEIGAAADADVEVELSPKKISAGMVLSRPIFGHDGLLLLKEGTCLTQALVDRILKQSRIDPLCSSVFVICKSQAVEKPRNADPVGATEVPPSVRPIPAIDLEPRAKEDSAVERRDEQPAERNATQGGAAIAQPEASCSVSRATTEQRKRVLVVDDSTFVCNALKRELRSAHIEAVATDSGWNALKLVEQGGFDAVLVDLAMPAMSGDELIRRLQQCASSVPCFVLTGNATKEIVVSLSKEPNFAGILTKPWDRDRLIAVIKDAIARSRPELAKGPA